MFASAYTDSAEWGRSPMNETHAQFFRELRELLGKHCVRIEAETGPIFLKFYLSHGGGWSDEYQTDTASHNMRFLRGLVEIPDAAQKEGEK